MAMIAVPEHDAMNLSGQGSRAPRVRGREPMLAERKTGRLIPSQEVWFVNWTRKPHPRAVLEGAHGIRVVEVERR